MSQAIEIARYPNRRLYDRSQKRYVTLGEIEAMVLSGQDVRIRDSKTQDDLTGMILTQIILERHPERMKMFSVPFLHGLLRADQMAIDWLTVYFGQAVEIMKRASSTSPMSGLAGFDLWTRMMSSMPQTASASETPSTSSSTGSTDNRSEPGSQDSGNRDEPAEKADLAIRLAELEQRLRRLESDRQAE